MANTFIWHELNTTDPIAAARFYGEVLGWRALAYEGGGDYRLLMAGDRPAGGLMLLPEPARDGGPFWAGYIGVSDVDAESRAIGEAGGATHVPPRDIPTVGRFAVVSDPQGAVFMLLAPSPRDEVPQAVPPGSPGHVAWWELHTSDAEAAWRFYAARFGWEKDTVMDMGPRGSYQLFSVDGRQAGGMMRSPLPRPMWLFYVAVADVDAAKAAIEAGGGAVLHGPAEVPGGVFIVQARDPQGAMFAVVGPRASSYSRPNVSSNA